MSGHVSRLVAGVRLFDERVDTAFDRVRSPRLDPIAYAVSSAADHSLCWHAAGVARELAGPGDLGRAARFSLALGAESAITNGPVKACFRRVRPAEYGDIEFRHGLRRPITSSFPSGHATAAFCAATLLGGGPTRYAMAAGVAATRVYVRLHHASDVLAGAAFGVGLGFVFRTFVDRRP
jgi:undecaprenyl-diphosphatase